jgi:hypothetical protein
VTAVKTKWANSRVAVSDLVPLFALNGENGLMAAIRVFDASLQAVSTAVVCPSSCAGIVHTDVMMYLFCSSKHVYIHWWPW